MAESLDLKIRVTGNEELDALIKKLNEGTGTLNDLTQAKKLLNKEFKVTELGTEKYNQLARSLAVVNDKQRDVRLQTRAGHEAYFKAGLELRQLALSGDFASSNIGKFSGSLANSVTNAVQLNRMLIPLGFTMGGLGIGAAALAGVLFSELLPALTKVKEESEKINTTLSITMQVSRELKDAVEKRATSEEREAELLRRRGEILGRLRFIESRGAGFGPLGEFIAKQFKKEVSALRAELFEINNLLGVYEDLLDRARRAGPAGTAAAGVPTAVDVSFLGRGQIVPTAPIDLGPAQRGIAKQRMEAALDKRMSDEFVQNLSSGFMSATSLLSQGFVRAFGLGNDLASQMLATLIAAASQALIIYGLRQLGSLGGPLGFLAMAGATVAGSYGGSSTTPVLAAERSMGGFNPMRFKPGELVASGILRGTDILVSVRRARGPLDRRDI